MDTPDHSYKWRAMSVVSIGVFMATLDGSIVNIALPTLTRYFNADISVIEWVILAYLLSITTLLLAFGRLSDMFGRKKIFSAGLFVFTIGSGLCGISATELQLIASRVVQGVGAAMIMANGPAIITEAFPHTERGRSLGLIGTVVSIGSMAGPVLGGLLIAAYSWQSIFFINIPIGLFGTYYAMRVLKPDERHTGQRFDIRGAVLMSFGVIALVLGITQVQDTGWDSPWILSLFAISVVSLALFLRVELGTDQPLIELSLFRNRPFSASNVSGFLSFVAMFSVILLMPYYMEDIMGFDTETVGLALSAVPLVMALVAPVSGWLSDRTNSFMLSSLGMAISTAGLLLTGYLGSGSSFTDIVLRLGLIGLGMGLFQSPNNSIVMGSVPRNRLGVAGGVLAVVRNLGMVTGIALTGAIFTATSGSMEAAGYAHEPAFMAGFRIAFIIAAMVCAAGILTSLMRGKAKASQHQPAKG